MENFSQKYGTFNNEIVKAIEEAKTSPGILTFESSASVGGAATEALTVTGLLSTDTILAVTQKTKGAQNLPLLGYTTQANNALTAVWSATPGAGAVILVTVKR